MLPDLSLEWILWNELPTTSPMVRPSVPLQCNQGEPIDLTNNPGEPPSQNEAVVPVFIDEPPQHFDTFDGIKLPPDDNNNNTTTDKPLQYFEDDKPPVCRSTRICVPNRAIYNDDFVMVASRRFLGFRRLILSDVRSLMTIKWISQPTDVLAKTFWLMARQWVDPDTGEEFYFHPLSMAA